MEALTPQTHLLQKPKRDRRALNDLSSILDHLRERSPTGATRVHLRIKFIIDLLTRHPHIGAPTEDPVIRRLAALPYPSLVFYEINAAEVIIYAIRHSSRDAPEVNS